MNPMADEPNAPGDSSPSHVESPCIGICMIEDGYCMGCGRTLDEIAAWPTLSGDERRQVVAELPSRPNPFDD